MIEGHCLCGNVRFRIDAESLPLYSCHCSMCRRTSGGGASVATLVPRKRFEWMSGQDGIGTYSRPAGYRGDWRHRCGTCTLRSPAAGVN